MSQPPFDSFNLGGHVGDEPAAVAANRQQLREGLSLPGEPYWLNQIHGNDVVDLDGEPGGLPEADASLEAEVLRLLRDGERIRAAKLYKERTGASLKEAKQAIEAVATRHRIAVSDTGCSGVVIFLIVVAVAAMAVVAALILTQRSDRSAQKCAN